MQRNRFEDRRRRVSSLLAQSIAETEIAKRLKVDQSTISRDIKVLKNLSQQFAYDLAKSDLAYCHKLCLNRIKIKRRGWEIVNGINYSIVIQFFKMILSRKVLDVADPQTIKL